MISNHAMCCCSEVRQLCRGTTAIVGVFSLLAPLEKQKWKVKTWPRIHLDSSWFIFWFVDQLHSIAMFWVEDVEVFLCPWKVHRLWGIRLESKYENALIRTQVRKQAQYLGLHLAPFASFAFPKADPHAPICEVSLKTLNEYGSKPAWWFPCKAFQSCKPKDRWKIMVLSPL